jgi:thiol-disulfide isomerase/thioredoxin
MHDAGYAVLNSEQITEQANVRLTTWASMGGEFRRGSKVMPRANLMAYTMVHIRTPAPVNGEEQGALYLRFSSQTVTDEQGHFKLTHLAAGEATLQDRVNAQFHGGPFEVSTIQARSMLAPGQTTSLQMGGTGRPVIGKLDLPEEFFKESDNVISCSVISVEPQNSIVGGAAKALFPAKKDSRPVHRSFVIVSDATFRIEDLPSGDYAFSGFKSGNDGNGPLFENRFTVGPIPNGQTDEPLDLGKIEVLKTVTLKPGVPAPELTATQLDGKPFDLSQCKGKYVLLDFWATWCGPCRGETPNLKAVSAEYGSDPRLQIVSLSFDQSDVPLKRYIEANKMTWTHALLTQAEQETVRETWGVYGIPAIVLISPDGKIVHRSLRGPAILQAIKTELKEPQNIKSDGK